LGAFVPGGKIPDLLVGELFLLTFTFFFADILYQISYAKMQYYFELLKTIDRLK